MFEKIVWKDAYNLNVPEIDSQHQRLVVIANELYDLANGDKDIYKRGIAAALKKLVDYTEYHLKFEEGFLRDRGYPQIDFHKMQHDQFISQVNAQVKKLVDSLNGTISVETQEGIGTSFSISFTDEASR